MSTDTTWQTLSASSEETEHLAERLALNLRGGEVIELNSDLGGGKTTFTRGLARGTGSQDKVASPTFTVSKIYKAPKFEIYHFDFYRLPEPGVVAEELAEVVGDPKVVVVVEWAGTVSHVLSDERLTINIAYTPDGDRQLTFTAPSGLEYLLEGLK
jgi:tRNA threonylcarbamoyladenosine biosynthesis protein TsaE